MSALPPFDPNAWRLAEHGDSRQRRWAAVLAQRCPAYEGFWQRHIVPLTFRPHQRDNYFLRPRQKQRLLRLADTSYALFLHLTGVLTWGERLRSRTTALPLRPTDAAYYLFSHAYSQLEAAGSFADAVNRVGSEYGGTKVFSVSRKEGSGTWTLHRRGQRGRFAGLAWHELADRTRVYRHALVHDRPLFLQSDRMPRPDADAIREMSGLTAIARLALRERSLLDACVPVEDVVTGIEERACRLADVLWQSATEALDQLGSDRYREDQLRLRPEESGLTLARILAARNPPGGER